MKQEMSINGFFTLYWVEDNELLDCEYATMEQALQRFEYLKNSWDGVLPTGLVAVKFVDHNFDKIERFDPYNSLTD